MRNFITLIEDAENAALMQYLRRDFYHGTARPNLRFHPAPAYFTTDIAVAHDYAESDSEVEDETPYLLRVKLHCTKPYIMDTMMMQDLHNLYEYGDLVKDLLAQGYDCVVGDTRHDEICVIDTSKVEIVEAIKLRDPGEESTRPMIDQYPAHNFTPF